MKLCPTCLALNEQVNMKSHQETVDVLEVRNTINKFKTLKPFINYYQRSE